MQVFGSYGNCVSENCWAEHILEGNHHTLQRVILYGLKCPYKDSRIINVPRWVVGVHRTSIRSKSELFRCPSMWCQIFLRQGL